MGINELSWFNITPIWSQRECWESANKESHVKETFREINYFNRQLFKEDCLEEKIINNPTIQENKL